MKQNTVEIIETLRPGPDFVLHTYRAPFMARTAEPAQFIDVRVGRGSHPILRRPFSICMAEGDAIQILFKIVGEGTGMLAERKAGESVDLIGPIGNPFRIGEKPAVLIAGGIGCAPLYFLAKRLGEKGVKSLFLYGARTGEDLVLTDRIGGVVDELILATEDGSEGIEGLITEVVTDYLDAGYSFYACGPEPMLISLREKLEQKNLTAQFSLENYMACGVGACQGCAVETNTGFKRVCVDGPVFHSDEIVTFPFTPCIEKWRGAPAVSEQGDCGESS